MHQSIVLANQDQDKQLNATFRVLLTVLYPRGLSGQAVLHQFALHLTTTFVFHSSRETELSLQIREKGVRHARQQILLWKWEHVPI